MEFAFYLFATVAIVAGTAHRLCVRIDRCATVLLTVVAIGLPMAQALKNSRLTYPFDHWDMYGSQTSTGEYIEFIAVIDGHVRPYPFDEIIFTEPRTLMARIEQLVRVCHCSHGDGLVDATIRSLSDLERMRTGATMRSLEIQAVSLRPAASSQIVMYRWTNAERGTY